jgi:phosphoribosylanthranilate isomerase
MKIKICGIRTYEEAMMVIEAGADMLGFNFYPQSPRYIIPGECMRLMVRLEMACARRMAAITTVGVFVNAEPEFHSCRLPRLSLDRIQLSGDEPPELLEELGERAFKVMRPTSAESLAKQWKHIRAAPWPQPGWSILTAWRVRRYGRNCRLGSGQPAWLQTLRSFLAGGLPPIMSLKRCGG